MSCGIMPPKIICCCFNTSYQVYRSCLTYQQRFKNYAQFQGLLGWSVLLSYSESQSSGYSSSLSYQSSESSSSYSRYKFQSYYSQISPNMSSESEDGISYYSLLCESSSPMQYENLLYSICVWAIQIGQFYLFYELVSIKASYSARFYLISGLRSSMGSTAIVSALRE